MKILHKILFLISSTLLFLVICRTVQAQIINEISSSTDNDDWIEIYAYEDINLANYRLTHLKSDGQEGDINIPPPTTIGPNSGNGNYKIIEVNNYLGNGGDRIRLYLIGNSIAISDISYGDQGGVCTPSTAGSIARIPDGSNTTVDRLSSSTKKASNGEFVTDPCPSPTPVPTNSPTNTPAPTSAPTNTPAPTATPVPSPTTTPKPSITPTKKITPTPRDYSLENEKLQADAENISNFRYNPDEAKNEENIEDVLGTTSNDVDQNSDVSPFAYVLFGLGLVFIAVSVYLFIKNKKPENK